MKFGSKVIKVRYTGDGGTPQMVDLGAYSHSLPEKPVWEVAVQNGDAGEIQVCLISSHILLHADHSALIYNFSFSVMFLWFFL